MKKILLICLSMIFIVSMVSAQSVGTLSQSYIYLSDTSRGVGIQVDASYSPDEYAITTTDARSIDYNPVSSIGVPSIIIGLDDRNMIAVCTASNGKFSHYLDTTGTSFPGAVGPYGLAVTDDGQVFVSDFNGAIYRWPTDSATTTATLIATVGTGAPNMRRIEAVGTGGDVRVFAIDGAPAPDVIHVYDNSIGTPDIFVEVAAEATSFPTSWTDTHTVGGDSKDTVYAADNQSNAGTRARLIRNVGSAYTVETTPDLTIPYQNFVVTGISVINNANGGNGLYAMFEAGGTYDGVAVGACTGGNGTNAALSPTGLDADLDAVYDAGPDGALNGAGLDGDCVIVGADFNFDIYFVSGGIAPNGTAGANATGSGYGKLTLVANVPVELSEFEVEVSSADWAIQ